MSNEKVKEHLDMLGLKVEDKVTGMKGTVTSVSFDLYGCIQAIIHPGVVDGKMAEQQWFDIARLTVLDPIPVMKQPNFEVGPQANGDQGPADKPRMNKA